MLITAQDDDDKQVCGGTLWVWYDGVSQTHSSELLNQ